MVFTLFILFVIILRISELILSKRNERWLLKNNAIEYGQRHYPFIIAVHVLFFISLIIEYNLQQNASYNSVLIVLYFLLIAFKLWVLLSLGKYWNTKIYRIRKVALIKRGPYRFVKHPNYLAVTLEILIIPLAFHLIYTAVVFTILNLIILYVRIKEENRVLRIE